MRSIICAFILLALPTTTLAQETHRGPESTLDRAITAPALPLPTLAPALSSSSAASGEWGLTRFIHVASGVLAGAWVGYMASQVAVGDWDDDGSMDRAGWAAGGAALGLTVSLSVPARGAAAPRQVVRPSDRRTRDHILTTEELRDSEGGNLYEVIRSLRPHWLRTRGTGSMRETARGSASGMDEVRIQVRPGIDAIRVYLDGSRAGGIDELRELDTGQVGEVRFLTSAQATQRWGAGHIHGAILVITAPIT